MDWRCDECNMKFESLPLYETHKRKFCVGGKVGDPSEMQSRASDRSLGERRWQNSQLSNHTVRITCCYNRLLETIFVCLAKWLCSYLTTRLTIEYQVNEKCIIYMTQ